MEVLGLDHVDLTVNDLERSTRFYEKVLGALGFTRVAHERLTSPGRTAR